MTNPLYSLLNDPNVDPVEPEPQAEPVVSEGTMPSRDELLSRFGTSFEKAPSSIPAEIGKGISAGARGLYGTVGGIAGLAGDALDIDGLKDWGLGTFKEQEEINAERNAPAIGSYKDIKSFSDFGQYAAFGLARGLTETAPLIAMGGIGGRVATGLAEGAVKEAIEYGVANGLTRSAAEKAVAAAVNSGGKNIAEGAFAEGLATQMGGEEIAATFGEKAAKAGADRATAGFVGSQVGNAAAITGQSIADTYGQTQDMDAALKYGGASGALNSLAFGIVAAPAFRKMIGLETAGAAKGSFMKHLAAKTATDTALLGGIAYPSSYIGQMAEAETNPNFDINSPEALQQRKEAVVSGAVMGAGFGLGFGSVEALGRNNAPLTANALQKITLAKSALPDGGKAAESTTAEDGTIYTGYTAPADRKNENWSPAVTVDWNGQPIRMQKDMESGHWTIENPEALEDSDKQGLYRVGDNIIIDPAHGDTSSTLFHAAQNALDRLNNPERFTDQVSVQADAAEEESIPSIPGADWERNPMTSSAEDSAKAMQDAWAEQQRQENRSKYDALVEQNRVSIPIGTYDDGSFTETTDPATGRVVSRKDTSKQTIFPAPATDPVERKLRAKAVWETAKTGDVYLSPDGNGGMLRIVTRDTKTEETLPSFQPSNVINEYAASLIDKNSPLKQVVTTGRNAEVYGIQDGEYKLLSSFDIDGDPAGDALAVGADMMPTGETENRTTSEILDQAREDMAKADAERQRKQQADDASEADFESEGGNNGSYLFDSDEPSEIERQLNDPKSYPSPWEALGFPDQKQALSKVALANSLRRRELNPEYNKKVLDQEVTTSLLDMPDSRGNSVSRGDYEFFLAVKPGERFRVNIPGEGKVEVKITEAINLAPKKPEPGEKEAKTPEDPAKKVLPASKRYQSLGEKSGSKLPAEDGERPYIGISFRRGQGFDATTDMRLYADQWKWLEESLDHHVPGLAEIAMGMFGGTPIPEKLNRAGFVNYATPPKGESLKLSKGVKATVETAIPDTLSKSPSKIKLKNGSVVGTIDRSRRLMIKAGDSGDYNAVRKETDMLPYRLVYRTNLKTGADYIEAHGIFTGDKQTTVRQMNSGHEVRAPKGTIIDAKSFSVIDRESYLEINKVRDFEGRTWTMEKSQKTGSLKFSMDTPVGLKGKMSRKNGFGVYDEIHKNSLDRTRRSEAATKGQKTIRDEKNAKEGVDTQVESSLKNYSNNPLTRIEEKFLESAITRASEYLDSPAVAKRWSQPARDIARTKIGAALIDKIRKARTWTKNKPLTATESELTRQFAMAVNQLRAGKIREIREKSNQALANAKKRGRGRAGLDPKEVSGGGTVSAREADKIDARIKQVAEGRLTKAEMDEVVRITSLDLTPKDAKFVEKVRDQYRKLETDALADSKVFSSVENELKDAVESLETANNQNTIGVTDSIDAPYAGEMAANKAAAKLLADEEALVAVKSEEEKVADAIQKSEGGKVDSDEVADVTGEATEAEEPAGIGYTQEDLEEARDRAEKERVRAQWFRSTVSNLDKASLDFLNRIGLAELKASNEDTSQVTNGLLRRTEAEMEEIAKMGGATVAEQKALQEQVLSGAFRTLAYSESKARRDAGENDPLKSTAAKRQWREIKKLIQSSNERPPERVRRRNARGAEASRKRGADAEGTSGGFESVARTDEATDRGREPTGVRGSAGEPTGDVSGASSSEVRTRNSGTSPASATRALATGAKREFVRASAGLTPEEVSRLTPSEIDAAREALQTVADIKSANKNEVIVGATPRAEDVSQKSRSELFRGIADEQRRYYEDRLRTDKIRSNHSELLKAGAFSSPLEFLKRVSSGDVKVTQDQKIRAKAMLELKGRFDWNNVATQVATFSSDGKRAEWAGYTAKEKGGHNIFLNLDAIHERSPIETYLHELQHTISGAKIDSFLTGKGIKLSAIETGALNRLNAMYEDALRKATARKGQKFVSVEASSKLARQKWALGKGENDRSFAGLANLHEFVTELQGNPNFHSLLNQLGFGKASEAEARTTFSMGKMLRDAFQAITEMITGRKVDPSSPLAKAFADSWSVTFDNNRDNKATPLHGKLAEFRVRESWIKDQIEARDLSGTTNDRMALEREWEKTKGVEPEAATPVEAPTEPEPVQAEVPMADNTAQQELKAQLLKSKAEREAAADSKAEPSVVAQKPLVSAPVETAPESAAVVEPAAKSKDQVKETAKANLVQANAELKQLIDSGKVISEGPDSYKVALKSGRGMSGKLARILATRVSSKMELGEEGVKAVEAAESAKTMAAEAAKAPTPEAPAAAEAPATPGEESPVESAKKRLADAKAEIERLTETGQIEINKSGFETSTTPEGSAAFEERRLANIELKEAKEAEAKAKKAAKEVAPEPPEDTPPPSDGGGGGGKGKGKSKPEVTKPVKAETPAPVAAPTEAKAPEPVKASVAAPTSAGMTEAEMKSVLFNRENQERLDKSAKISQAETQKRVNELKEKITKLAKSSKDRLEWEKKLAEAGLPLPGAFDMFAFSSAKGVAGADKLTEAQWNEISSRGRSKTKAANGGIKTIKGESAGYESLAVIRGDEPEKDRLKRLRAAAREELKRNTDVAIDSLFGRLKNGASGAMDRESLYQETDDTNQKIWNSEVDKILSKAGVNLNQWREFADTLVKTDPRFEAEVTKRIGEAREAIEDGSYTDMTFQESPTPRSLAEEWATRSLRGKNPTVQEMDALQVWIRFQNADEAPTSMYKDSSGILRTNPYEGYEGAKFSLQKSLEPALNSSNESIRKTAETLLQAHADAFAPESRGQNDEGGYESLGISSEEGGSSIFDRLRESAPAKAFLGENIATYNGGTYNKGGYLNSSVKGWDMRQVSNWNASRGEINAQESRAQLSIRKLGAAVKASYKEAKDAPTELMNTALGKITNHLTDEDTRLIAAARKEGGHKAANELKAELIQKNRDEFRVQQKMALEALPDDVSSAIIEMTDHISALSKTLNEKNIITGDLKATVDANGGIYLNRSYQIFDDPKWTDKVRKMPEVINAASKLLRDRLVGSEARKAMKEMKDNGESVNREKAIEIARDRVTDEMVTESLERLLSVSEDGIDRLNAFGKMPGRKDLSVFDNRGQVAQEIQDLWGVQKDPATNYTRTISKMASLIGDHEFLTDTRNQGLKEGWIWNPKAEENKGDRPPAGYSKFTSEDNAALAPLDGMYMKNDMIEAMYQMFPRGGANDSPAWLRYMMKLTGWTMGAKTVLSPAAQIRNFMGNPIFLVAGGNFNLGTYGKFKEAAQITNPFKGLDTAEKVQDMVEKLHRLGIMNQSVGGRMIRELLQQKQSSSIEGDRNVFQKYLLDPVSAVGKNAQRAYEFGDAVYKTTIWMSEREKYQRAFPEMSEADLDQRAADIARAIHPTYDLSPSFTKELQKFPIIAPFIRFTTEIYRTSLNLAKQAHSEIKEGRASGNKELENIGWGRVKGMMIVAAGPSLAIAAWQAAAGVTSEDQEAVRKFLPEWQKNNQLFVWKQGNGKVGYYDWSYLDAYSTPIREPIKAIFRAVNNSDNAEEGLKNAVIDGVRQAVSPFSNEQILSGSIIDLLRNKNSGNGAPVFNPQDSVDRQAEAIGLHLAAAFQPGALVSASRITKAAMGQTSDSGREYNLNKELAAPFVGRLAEVDLANALQFKASKFLRNERDAAQLLNHEFLSQGSRTEQDVIGGYERSNTARQNLVEELRKDYKSAIALGISPKQATEILKGSHVGNDMIQMITSGMYKPIVPSKQSLNLVQSRGQTDRIRAITQAQRNAPQKVAMP